MVWVQLFKWWITLSTGYIVACSKMKRELENARGVQTSAPDARGFAAKNLLRAPTRPPATQARYIAIQWISVNKTYYAIHWITIYPVDSVIHTLNNWALMVSAWVLWVRSIFCSFLKQLNSFFALRWRFFLLSLTSCVVLKVSPTAFTAAAISSQTCFFTSSKFALQNLHVFFIFFGSD